MRYADYKLYDTANGPGVRLSLFVQGCPHHCPGCFNPETWDFNGGEEYTIENSIDIITHCKREEIAGLSILGGEPFALENDIPMLVSLLAVYKETVKKPVWVWTGYTIEELITDPIKIVLLSFIDVLVDGPFIEAKKNIKLVHRGSSNQRVIDVQATLEKYKENPDSNFVVLYEE
jgi:anaerobic ribonucleoside-triphosphate reductase activating protein